ncbi:uncharacterized protein LOC114042481 [Vombatus ursinus]|uniref:CRIB domain-containing protein n=1 Tax=Vombatus ursinus TaxID=29139 RepID=A0A4X2KLK6_VOMUR|nr:uncharacterized protein LOC114042481 [Vombatus ursinus]
MDGSSQDSHFCGCCILLVQRKTRCEIYASSNFQHRRQTEFDHQEHTITGFPLQWQSLLEAIVKEEKPIWNPSSIIPILIPWCCSLFRHRKRRHEVSAPCNFQHRVHMVFNEADHTFMGLPLQWSSLEEDPLKGEKVIADPSSVTPILNPWCCIVFGKKKTRLEISRQSNFEHRINTEFDSREQKFTGTPLLWHSLLADTVNQPIVDPSSRTYIQLAAMKVL